MQMKTNQAYTIPCDSEPSQRMSDKVHAIDELAYQMCVTASAISQLLFHDGKQFDGAKPDLTCIDDELVYATQIMKKTMDILNAAAEKI